MLNAGHDKDFRPAKVVKERIYTASFEHIDEAPPKRKDYKDPEGGVLTGPVCFLTNPMKKGKVGRATSFGGIIPYTEDFYDIKR